MNKCRVLEDQTFLLSCAGCKVSKKLFNISDNWAGPLLSENDSKRLPLRVLHMVPLIRSFNHVNMRALGEALLPKTRRTRLHRGHSPPLVARSKSSWLTTTKSPFKD